MSIMSLATELFLLFLLFGEGWSRDRNNTQNRRKCFGLEGCGYTVPDGDITLRYGEPLKITCNLYEDVARKWSNQNEGGWASSRLYFRRNKRIINPNNEYDPHNKTAERVEILNETSIRFSIERPEKTGLDNFFCYFNQSAERQQAACNNIVVVGLPPQNVVDFSCISRNLENLTCSWTAPENFAKTKYVLTYYFPKNRNVPSFMCPTNPMYDNGRNMSCTWTIFTDPQYRQSQPRYKFVLEMSNALGNLTQEFDFKHFKRMRPEPVDNLTAIATSPHSIKLNWTYNSKLLGFREDLQGRILYKCQYCNQSLHVGGTFISEKLRTTNYELKDLRYAHTLYEIQVSIKPIDADESMWSEAAVQYGRTDSEKPERPPNITVGSFQMVNTVNSKLHKDVYVYFQSVEEFDKNGQIFTYDVESDPPLPVIELTKTYVKLGNLDPVEYVVRVWSKNEIGRSSNASQLIIPAYPMGEPEQFLNIERSSDTHELEWEPPKSSELITNYTLFWCTNERERPHQCKGYLDWTVVSNETFKYNLTLQNDNIYQFAIAANSYDSSSGMRWAECTVLANRTVGKMRNVWVNHVGPNYIELNWKLDCSDILSEVTGYVIYYCTTNSISGTTCEGDLRNYTVDGNLNIKSAIVPNLKPYTTYLLSVSVRSKRAESQPSDFLRNVTLESAPSTPPLNVKITEVTNSSITLEWSPPEKLNGAIKHYRIIYNDISKEVDSKKTRETLTDLESYKNFTIYMQACTVACSNNSEILTTATKIGTPAQIIRPFELPSNGTICVVGWEKPNPPRGNLDLLQLSITHNGVSMDDGEIITLNYTQNYTMEKCRSDLRNSFFVSIRALNFNNGTYYEGPWSDTLKIYCNNTPWWYICLLAAAGILAFIFVIYVGRKGYEKFKYVRDVVPKLPAGLEPALDLPQKNPNTIDRNFGSDPDEELLLQRITEKCRAGDSSGCSSGQESITSSVESTHLSMDSGTDQPRNVADDNKENSLRLRNVSTKGYVMHDATPAVNRGTKPVPAPAGSYCLLGVDPSNKPIQDTPYVTISGLHPTLPPYIANDQPPTAPPPYVMTDIFKTPNPGYVPYSPKEPASKHTGYVVAGDLSSTPIAEPKAEYMVVDTQVGLKPSTVWQPPSVEPSLTKTGYVSVGDAPPPTVIKETKGYVPHRQFDSKALKED